MISCYLLQAPGFALRTYWIDKRLAGALCGSVTEDGATAESSDGVAALPRQVVLLGAGMDTRAWRDLDCPTGPCMFHRSCSTKAWYTLVTTTLSAARSSAHGQLERFQRQNDIECATRPTFRPAALHYWRPPSHRLWGTLLHAHPSSKLSQTDGRCDAGVSWFEVDQADVLAAKARALNAAAAQPAASPSADPPGGGDPAGQVGAGRSSFAFPLQVSQRTTLAADLGRSGWLAALEAAGWDRKVRPLRRLL